MQSRPHSDLASGLRKAGETRIEDLLTEPADKAAFNGGCRLEEIGGRGEIFAATGQGGDGGR
jgi:hypothetical protein